MNNQKQQAPYDVNEVIQNLLNTNAQLTLENAELRATLTKITSEHQGHEHDSSEEVN